MGVRWTVVGLFEKSSVPAVFTRVFVCPWKSYRVSVRARIVIKNFSKINSMFISFLHFCIFMFLALGQIQHHREMTDLLMQIWTNTVLTD